MIAKLFGQAFLEAPDRQRRRQLFEMQAQVTNRAVERERGNGEHDNSHDISGLR